MSVRIVGAGLIGTSVALALKGAGESVEVSDLNPKSQALAADLVGASHLQEPIKLVLVATPVQAISDVLQAEFAENPQAIFMDFGGLKSNLIQEVEKFPDLSERFISLHPMAGREISGPESARADLFNSRAILMTPTTLTNQATLDAAHSLVKTLGGTGYLIAANDHDQIISAISHMPQLVSTLLGASLVELESEDLAFSGGGLRDMTRLAGSDAGLWSELFLANKVELIRSAHKYSERLDSFIEALENEDREAIKRIIESGNDGRALIPGKHGAQKRDYTFLPVVIDDKAGQLARLFEECAAVEVNVEDLSIEHSPGQETGLITLALSESDAIKLQEHLLAAGWRVHSPLK